MSQFLSKISQILTTIFQGLIRVYQYTLSPDHGIIKKPYGHCQYYPTCSEYAYQALGRFGLMRGLWLTGRRLLKCHPFHAPAYDPVPERG